MPFLFSAVVNVNIAKQVSVKDDMEFFGLLTCIYWLITRNTISNEDEGKEQNRTFLDLNVHDYIHIHMHVQKHAHTHIYLSKHNEKEIEYMSYR